jgi:hypothetical protein
MNNLMDAKIDAYIALNAKHWKGIQAMTRERLERTLVALYVQRQEAHERGRSKGWALTPQEKAKGRSEGYWEMSADAQWTEDKRLGILDWDGK